MERDKLVAEWKALIRRDKVSQVATPSGGRQPADEAIRETARQLGLSKDDVHRAIKVASITPEAQQAAHEVGNYVEQCQNELERAVAAQKPGKGANHE